MILVDTDVLIWNLRGNEKAAKLLDRARGLALCAVTYMELVQGMRDRRELQVLRQAMAFWSATIIHIDEHISARASFLVEQHALAHALPLADALIAATALERGLDLVTGNDKHYRPVKDLALKRFRP